MSARKIKAGATKHRPLFVPALVRLRRGTPSEVHDQGYQQQHEEYIEDDLSDASRGAGNSAEAESGRNQSESPRTLKPNQAWQILLCLPVLLGSTRGRIAEFQKEELA